MEHGFDSSDRREGSPPIHRTTFRKVTPGQAAVAVLAAAGLRPEKDDVSGVTFIHAVNPAEPQGHLFAAVRPTDLEGHTLETVQLIDVPLIDAVHSLAAQANLNVIFGGTSWDLVTVGPGGKLPPVIPTQVDHFELSNISAGRAMLALLNQYDLELLSIVGTGVHLIQKSDPSRPNPSNRFYFKGARLHALDMQSLKQSQTRIETELSPQSVGLFKAHSVVLHPYDGVRQILLAETRRALAILAVACERFRLANGNYPDTLKQLTPYFSGPPPVDYCTEEVLRYRRQGDRAIGYSVGMNGLDDSEALDTQTPTSTLFPPSNTPAGDDLTWILQSTN